MEDVTKKIETGNREILRHLARAVRTFYGARDPDIEQEAFLRTLQACRRSPVHHPLALIRKIVHDTVADHWRAHELRQWTDLDDVPEQVVADRPRLELEFDQGRQRSRLRRAILRLGCDIRGPVYLFYVESYPIQTIARIYGKSPSAVKMALYRGRRRLERMFPTNAEKNVALRRTSRAGTPESR